MFGYFLLLSELAVLAFLYWLFCVRKVSAYKVQGNPWGMYPCKRKCAPKFPVRNKLGHAKGHRNSITIHQTRKNGWVFSDRERQNLQETTGVDLEVTASHLLKDEQKED